MNGARSSRFPTRAAVVWVLGLLFAPPASAITNEECLDCHRDPGLSSIDTAGRERPLYVGAAAYSSSIHGEFSCTDCHAGVAEIPHESSLQPVDCSSCHGDAAALYAQSLHGAARAAGNQDAPSCADCHGSHDILPASNTAARTHPIQLVGTCARCHANSEVVRKNHIAAPAAVAAYTKSIHGKMLLQDGNTDAPNCGTCHPPHEMRKANDPASTVHRTHVAETCGLCHGAIHGTWSESVHGAAVMRGEADAPTCIDCHGEHEIEAPSDPQSTVYPANLVKSTCVRCHDSLVLARRYGFETGRLGSFEETYHGLASRKGDLRVANCASCHGVHDIFPHEDPRSTVHPGKLKTTCGQCHSDASEAFASIRVHAEAMSEEDLRALRSVTRSAPSALATDGAPAKGGDDRGDAGSVADTDRDTADEDRRNAASDPLGPTAIVRTFYIVLIVVVIGGMVLHNLILWLHHVVEKRRRERTARRVPRFTKFEVVEHAVNGVAFFTLVLTGFALKFPDAGWVGLTERIGMTESVRGLIHRGAAIAMIAVALSHAGFLFLTRRGHKELGALRIRIDDVTGFVRNMGFHLGLRKDAPRFARFDYAEKAEYFALLWGTWVMIGTGLVLWFPTVATQRLPAWAVPLSEVVHYYEAWLAFLAIVVWHLYFVIANPEVYPMNLTWMDGRVSEEEAEKRSGEDRLRDDRSIPRGSGSSAAMRVDPAELRIDSTPSMERHEGKPATVPPEDGSLS